MNPSSKRATILIVDDEAPIRFAVRDYLEVHGLDVEEAADSRSVRAALRRGRPDAIVLDYRLPEGDTLDLLSEIKAVHADLPVVILTAHASIDLAVTAVKLGADHFMTKPVELSALHVILQRLLVSRKAQKRDAAVRSRSAVRAVDPFVGSSEPVQRLRDDAERVAGSDRPVVVLGETGAGKGVLARWLHRASPRAEEPFVDLNCAGLARDLVESELFGHERGAFTGAVAARAGVFQLATKGTVFLDEVGELPPPMQVKLLRVLQDSVVRPVGSERTIDVDVRIVAATNRDLEREIARGAFREDLFYRLNVVPIFIAPLRERRSDVALLVRHFLDRRNAKPGTTPISIPDATMVHLWEYDWPGNVRELENVVERVATLAEGEEVTIDELPLEVRTYVAERRRPRRTFDADPMDLQTAVEQFERSLIEQALQHTSGNKERAARLLGLKRTTLVAKLRRRGELRRSVDPVFEDLEHPPLPATRPIALAGSRL
jgi:DNA-binding NtrC family response regulator